MVLESLASPFRAENKPSVLILFGFLYAVVALLLAINTFPSHASIVFIALIVVASVPLMYGIIKEEEKKDISEFHEVALLKEHGKALKAFMALFFGQVLGVSIFYIYAPLAILLAIMLVLNQLRIDTNTTRETKYVIGTVVLLLGIIFIVNTTTPNLSQTFEAQIQTLNALGNDIQVTGNVTAFGNFLRIFTNNVKVLLFCVLFSFLYGSGAIFVLTWNASVIGVAVGDYVRSNLAEAASSVGLTRVIEYVAVINVGLLQYVIHGVPEILAYFVAALAGGIISIAVIRHDFKGKKFEHVVLDSADLILISLALIFVAAILEVWVTPIIFG